ncbi:MAG: hypothetical protein ACRDTA_10050 [Pseudonocardiaceae bacterium]
MSDAANTASEHTPSISEIIEAARRLGVTAMPEAARLTSGRVWPTGHGWVGEIGAGTSIRALDDMYESKEAAIEAVRTEIRQLRGTTVQALVNAQGEAARLAATSDNWEPAVLEVYATPDQRKPEFLRLDAGLSLPRWPTGEASPLLSPPSDVVEELGLW